MEGKKFKSIPDSISSIRLHSTHNYYDYYYCERKTKQKKFNINFILNYIKDQE